MATTTCKPKLPQLSTPVNSNFPLSVSGSSLLSAKPLSATDGRTPISPPLAYVEYLRTWSMNSPRTARPSSLSGNTTPSTSSSHSDCSCKAAASAAIAAAAGEDTGAKKTLGLETPLTAPVVPPSPFTRVPMSAPAHGASFPSLKVPPSPSVALSPYPTDSPSSALSASFSSRSNIKFDWDSALSTALKARSNAGEARKQPSRTSVRHIREVVTRTVTYTPRMKPAPKGKRRQLD
ncbi:hypothetical protein Cpir12675_003576 [Ceratocystis pirilliformis]|uniref:Uncharacterized protein n=2 Tax=Ceratocystis TaxID=5157 RepID=A0ABR4MAX2_9PEZI